MASFWRGVAVLAGCWPALAGAGEGVVGHTLSVTLDPPAGRLEVRDTVRLPPELVRDHQAVFTLRPGLRLLSSDQAAVTPEGEAEGTSRYRVTWPQTGAADGYRVTLHYEGVIREDPTLTTVTYRGGHPTTAGTIAPEGALLGGASRWYPDFDHALVTYDLTLTLPPSWRGLVPGEQPAGQETVWRQRHPLDEVLIAAAPWVEYRRPGPHVTAVVLLRQKDDALAETYLAATQAWLDFYGALLGPYPHATFTVAENHWESGLGMPSFTLLGPKVMRLPFIPETSLPHEILHAWWGNGVYLAEGEGNWCEGLTAYLADHLIQERKGLGGSARRDALQRFGDLTAGGKAFPLGRFQGRGDGASQAVGYDQGMMFFHGLRREVGDRSFIKALRLFYQENRFRRAGFDALRRAFEQVAGRELASYFKQGLERSGAPELSLADLQIGSGGEVTVTLEQRQPDPPFTLKVPLALWREGETQPRLETVSMTERRQSFRMAGAGRPLALAVDPHDDLFRRLDPRETPPALSQAFGADKVIFVMPDKEKESQPVFRAMAGAWGLEPRTDGELELLPWDGAVWALGWENKHITEVRAMLERQGVRWEGDGLIYDGRHYGRREHVFVMAGRKTQDRERLVVWLSAPAESVPALTAKLPHYGREGILIFRAGPEPTLLVKGRWPVREHPLTRVWVPEGRDLIEGLPPSSPLSVPG